MHTDSTYLAFGAKSLKNFNSSVCGCSGRLVIPTQSQSYQRHPFRRVTRKHIPPGTRITSYFSSGLIEPNVRVGTRAGPELPCTGSAVAARKSNSTEYAGVSPNCLRYLSERELRSSVGPWKSVGHASG